MYAGVDPGGGAPLRNDFNLNLFSYFAEYYLFLKAAGHLWGVHTPAAPLPYCRSVLDSVVMFLKKLWHCVGGEVRGKCFGIK